MKSRAHTLAGLICLVPGVRQVPDVPFQFPETRAGVIAEAWFEAFNSGEAGPVIEFERNYRISAKLEQKSAEERGSQMGQMQAMLGTLTPRSVLGEETSVLTLLVDSSKLPDMQFQTSFELETEPPYNLVSFGLRPAAGRKKLGPYKEWESLEDLLGQVRADSGVPAVAAALIRGGEIEHAAVGLRRSNSEDSVQAGDAFHLGSVAKPITATMIARLIETDVLDWDLTVSAGLPEVDALPAYRARTLDELLSHRSGLAGYLTFDDEEMARRLGVETASAEEQRAAFVAEVLSSEPATQGSMLYSNAGYAVAARMAEVATGEPWETLVVEYVFEPMAMTSAGLGWPATATRSEAPSGHYRDGSSFRPQRVGEYVFLPFVAPAGHVHGSALDLGRFARSHLRGLRGSDDVLKATTVQRLHTPPEGESYASGWMIDKLPEGGTRHWHDGTAGTFYASIQLFPERDLGLVVLLNAGDESVVKAITEAITAERD